MVKKIAATIGLIATSATLALAQPKVIAHRGYWVAEGSAQNSLASFAKADAIGVYGSEFDVWFTADDQLVVNHDRTFKGVCMPEATGAEATAVVLDNGEQLPTLDAYLQLAQRKPGTRLILEMKSLPTLQREDLAAAKIVEALRSYDLLERTDIIAFSINACLAFKKLLHSPEEDQGAGAGRHRLFDGGAPQAPRLGEGGARQRAGSQRLDRRFRGGHALLHRHGRGLHHDQPARTPAGHSERAITRRRVRTAYVKGARPGAPL